MGARRILVWLGEGRSVREAPGATTRTAPHAGRMVGKLLLLLLLLRVMLREASIGGDALLLIGLLLQVVLALWDVELSRWFVDWSKNRI